MYRITPLIDKQKVLFSQTKKEGRKRCFLPFGILQINLMRC
jgi:hypothetical protein